MTPHELITDSLTELQLQVARRADELAACVRAQSSLNLPCWFQAEEEILATFKIPASTVEWGRAGAQEEGAGAASILSFANPSAAVA